MKITDILYIMLSSSMFIRWLNLAKDTASITIAFVMSVLGICFLWYKTRLMRAEALLKEKELNGKI